MAKGFFDIETTEPAAGGSSTLAKADRDARQDAQDRAEAEKLKETITRQLEAGQEPQIILYTALKAIGLLTHDPAFTEAATGKIDAVYSDLAQQSFIQDNNAIAQARLETMQRDYNDKLRRSINRQLAGYRRVEKALQEVLQAVDATEPQEDILT